MPDATAVDDEELRRRLIHDLRAYGTAFTELGRAFGVVMGLHTTDATALVEIMEATDAGEPLTQSGLSRRIGLTGGATSSLLNRLEEVGHVRRARDSADRRVVTLHATDGVDAEVGRFFAPLAARIDAMMDGYSPAALREIERFVVGVSALMDAYRDEVTAPERTDR